MAYYLDIVDSPVTCHAWNGDHTLLALCPNTPDLLIYRVNGKESTLLYTLSEHTQVISSVDWHKGKNRIITCSHDRNAYVWTPEQDPKSPGNLIWKRDLVVLRLNRAATYCRWAPDGESFIVATGHDKVRICAYKAEQNFWVSTSYENKNPTSVTADFAPDGVHFLVSCTDRKFYYMTRNEDESAEHAEKTAKPDKSGKKEKKVSPILSSFAAQGWVNASAISPDGSWIAYTSQDAYIRFIKTSEVLNEDAPKRDRNIEGLPLLALKFVNDHCLVGAGFDCAPRLFFREGDDWSDLGLIDLPDIREAPVEAAKGGLAGKMAAFGQAPKPASGASKSLHYNIINGICIRSEDFTTCGNDGRIAVWPFAAIQKHFAGKQLF